MKYRLYPAKLIRVIDGDTVKLNLDLGLNVHVDVYIRLARVNAPECRGEAKGLGIASRHCAMKWFRNMETNEDLTLVAKTLKKGKYGRWIAEVMLLSEEESLNLADYLVSQGHAKYVDYD